MPTSGEPAAGASRNLLAWGVVGVLAQVAFLAGWLLAGFWQPRGYSLVNNSISDMQAATAPGGHSVPAIKRAARHLDGWMPIFLSPKRYLDSNRMLDEYLSEMERKPDDVARAVTLIVGVTGAAWSHDEAISMAGELFPTGGAGLDRYVITGPTEECVERIAEFESNGARSVAIFPVRRDFAPMFAELRHALIENRASRTPTPPA